jgi:hypothetical protein
MAIREVLEEELENSLRMEQRYSDELQKLPRGSLVQKVVKGHVYHYLVYRDESGRVRQVYKGRPAPEEIARYAALKKKRAQYRNLRAKAREQIRFLRRALRAKAAV